MADGVSVSVFTKPFTEMLAGVERDSNRATMYALRAAGRAVAKSAKAKAPVYDGPPRMGVVRGELKRSIRNARKLNGGAGVYGLMVGPMGGQTVRTAGPSLTGKPARTHLASTRYGGHGKAGGVYGVQLYRRKQEDRYGYMQAGIAGSELAALYEAAVVKALARYG